VTGPDWTRLGERFHELADLPVEEREARLAAIARSAPALAAELAALLAADRAPGRLPERAPLPTADAGSDPDPLAALAAGDRVGPYRILEEIARGGMGIVYRAERADGAFERQVAIKVMRPELAGAALGGRFAEERRILAAVDHPGIARLLDGGATPDGRLYLVLELVEGRLLDRWAAEQPLGERLRLFVEVCDAVEHAHRRLVLHRDLKPANILVTAAGQPRLLDFGIARLLGAPQEPGALTRLGLRPLTPEYASPEQLRGEPLTTASDVYSLGVVLFELLTGRRPLELDPGTSPEERARRIESGPGARPSAALRRTGAAPAFPARRLEGDLDAIVGRALAADPDRRYPSAAALAADLERHRAGRPVEARPPALAERAALFVRRHRAAVAASALLAAVLAGATLFSLRQARLAARERDRAERRYDDLHALAHVFLFELPDRIERLPGSTAARSLLVETGLAYLDRLRAEGGDEPALLAELAAGYERLGRVQGGLHAANVGLTAEALATLDRAVELREAVRARRPDAAAARGLAAARLARGTLRFKSGAMAEAGDDARAALALLEAATPGRSDPAADRALAGAHSLAGFLAAGGGDLAGSEALLRRALAELDRLGAATAEDLELRRERAETLHRLGVVLGQDLSNSPEVARLWTEAIDAQRALVAERPGDEVFRRGLIGTLGMLAIVRDNAGRDGEALALNREALALSLAAVAADPEDFDARRRVAQLRARRASTLADLGRLDEATALGRESLAEVETLLARNPGDVTVEVLIADARDILGSTLLLAARAETTASRWRAARDELARSLEVYDRLIARGVLAENLGEAGETVRIRAQIAECDRALGLAPSGSGAPSG